MGMKANLRLLLMIFVGTVVVQAAVPRLVSLQKDYGQAGQELVVDGENLDSRSVAKMFLSREGKDNEVEMKEQSDQSIRFTLPAGLALGRYNLTIQTAGPNPSILEQPLSCEIVDEEGAREMDKLAAESNEELVVIEPEPEEPTDPKGKKKKN
jgi:hypothetical protein